MKKHWLIHSVYEERWNRKSETLVLTVLIPVMVSAKTGSKMAPLYNPYRLALYQVVGDSPEMVRLRALAGAVWFCHSAPVSASVTSIKKAWKAPSSADQDKRKLSHDTSLMVKFVTTGFSSSGWWQIHQHRVIGLGHTNSMKTEG